MAKRRYPHAVVAALVKRSNGTCYWPTCRQPIVVIVEKEPSFNYEIAHIRALNKTGPRYEATMTDEQRNSFRNPILLCRPHHDNVDRINPTKYSPETLDEWKRNAESPEIAAVLSNHLYQVTDVELLDQMTTAMDQRVKEIKDSAAQLEASNSDAIRTIRELIDRMENYQLVGDYLDADQIDMFVAATETLRRHLNEDIVSPFSTAAAMLNEDSIGHLQTILDNFAETVDLLTAAVDRLQQFREW